MGGVLSSDADLAAIFVTYDVDNSGAIDAEELGKALAELGLPLAQADVAELLKKYDADASGTIEFAEFEKFVADARIQYASAAAAGAVDALGSMTSFIMSSASRSASDNLLTPAALLVEDAWDSRMASSQPCSPRPPH